MHVLRTACRQETMRYGRLGLPKGESTIGLGAGARQSGIRLTASESVDALYDLLIIEASHIDQIMAHLSTTSPMA